MIFKKRWKIWPTEKKKKDKILNYEKFILIMNSIYLNILFLDYINYKKLKILSLILSIKKLFFFFLQVFSFTERIKEKLKNNRYNAFF